MTYGNTAWFDSRLDVSLINQNTRQKVRDYVQHKCSISIICSRFNKVENFYARMVSYNKKGMTFESSQHYKKGTNIFFRIQNCVIENTDPELCEGLRTASLAEVVCCEKIKNQEEILYKTSVKYHEYY
ncbi:Uncharacterized protein dnl_24900 [Desulfonema limicola]|uniref:Uncharacterized protein n=2 Tax=Desulfonema limicola TaxID=45656 RepID=A0A975B7E1_9BACT|nr:Uncharacterized protein dnl_24900 [Desulfonema limicola]